jgi:TusE/DsrC/DsvC family sulfur relay protein
LEPSIEGKGTSLILLTRIQTLKGAEKGFRGEEKRAARGDVDNICSANEGDEIKTLRFSGKEFYVDSQDFLRDMDQWDEDFAVVKAHALGMTQGLSDEHWKVIRYLRESYKRDDKLPTVYECCKANGLDIDGLEKLFPCGYRRGAVMISGLR